LIFFFFVCFFTPLFFRSFSSSFHSPSPTLTTTTKKNKNNKQWTGKSCVPVARVGPEINYALGYSPYNISVDPAFAAPLADALTGPLREAGAAIESKLGGLSKLVPAFLGGGGGAGGSSVSNVAVSG
jgi:hypothetical protein